MNELSRARGFYPVVALLPQGGTAPIAAQAQRKGSGKGKSKGSGKGKSKGGGKGRSPPGKGMPMRRPPWRPPAATSSASASAAAPPESRSTGSGATAQHGPRFKRMRAGGFVKEAGSADDGFVAEEVLTAQPLGRVVQHRRERDGAEAAHAPPPPLRVIESPSRTAVDAAPIAAQEEALSVEPGKGILDCGATRPVIGELTWHRWLQAIRHLGREAEVKYTNVVRT